MDTQALSQSTGLLLFVLSVMGVLCALLFSGLLFFVLRLIKTVDETSESVGEFGRKIEVVGVRLNSLELEVKDLARNEHRSREVVGKLHSTVLLLEREVRRQQNDNSVNQ